MCQQPPLCVWSDLLCKRGLVGGSREGDTDLPLINTDGDQGERQDDEDGSSHINHPSSRLACVCVLVYVCVCVGVCKYVLTSFLTEITLWFTG